MTLFAALPMIGAICTTALLGLHFFKRVFRSMPVFVAYQGYSIVFATLSIFALQFAKSTEIYIWIWSACIAIDTLFYLGVMSEIGRNVLSHNRAARMPGGFVAGLFIAATVMTGLLARWTEFPQWGISLQLEFRAMQMSAILEVAGLLTIVWWSSLRKLQWPVRELRIVTGMGAWAMVQLCVLILHEHGFIGPGYHWLDLLTPISVLGVLIYWLYYFWLDPGTPAKVSWRGAEVPDGRRFPAGAGPEKVEKRLGRVGIGLRSFYR